MNHYIGLDLGGTNLKYALGNKHGEVLVKLTRPSQASESLEKILHNMFAAVEKLLEIAKLEKFNVISIGVGSPGSIDFENGRVIGEVPNLKGWTDVPIREILQERFRLPVWTDNDANMVAIAEARVGAGKGFRNLVFITVGTGIGGGIIIDGKLYRGASFNAAEIGHTSIIMHGKRCKCGNIGCLEMYASAPAIVKLYMEKLNQENVDFDEDIISTELIFERVKERDVIATETLDEACEALGAGLANVVNLINPEAIIIGGGVSEAGESFLGRVRKVVFDRALPAALPGLRIIKAELGNDAGIVGAILLAADNT
ncbi:ROK family protein [candidate division KSB1 bacterium]|nr:ROK family protein [candidate division KSB1 bacterium]